VRYYGAGVAPSDDKIIAMTADADGFIYVTGSSLGRWNQETDWLTAKVSPLGQTVWTAHYNGPANGNDYPAAIAVDDDGGVYVAGYSEATGTGNDITLIKYNTNGVRQWEARYDGPDNADDRAAALALDQSGNVYITGFSRRSSYDYEFVTIKYNDSGTEQWVALFAGLNWHDGTAAGLDVDGDGNVYITAAHEGEKYAAIKYNAMGVQQWAVFHDGYGDELSYPVAIKADGVGNVYVTGYILTGGAIFRIETVKYDASGDELWKDGYQYDGYYWNYPVDLALDDNGNAYVAGYSQNHDSDVRIVTLKYTAEGIREWAAIQETPQVSESRAVGLAIDTDESVVVADTRFRLTRYDAAGEELWSVRYDEPEDAFNFSVAMTRDADGNICIGGYGPNPVNFSDFLAVKYNDAGEEQFVYRFNGPENSFDQAVAFAVDEDGNVYIAATSLSRYEGYRILTLKYNISGTEEWSAYYTGDENSNNHAVGIAIDADGNAYVTGYSKPESGAVVCVTVKYNSAGDEIWAMKYPETGESHFSNIPTAIAVAGDSAVYVTGYGSNLLPGTAYVTIRYSPFGEEEWAAGYYHPDYIIDKPSSIAIDGEGNVIVTGFVSPSWNTTDFATVKYDPQGEELWAAHYNGPYDGYDRAITVAADADGNVYVTGTSESMGEYGPQSDFATIKYTASGEEQWVARYNGPSGLSDIPMGLALGPAGSVYVTGYGPSPDNGDDFVTIKYDASGEIQWESRYDGPLDFNYDRAAAIVLDGEGNAYVTGASQNSPLAWDIVTVKYDASGTEQGIGRYNRTKSTNARSIGVGLDGSGNNIFVAGNVGYHSQSVIAVLRYSGALTSVKRTAGIADRYILEQNYPNPFNPSTTIRFSMPERGNVNLTVYNVLGQRVAELLNDEIDAGVHELLFDASSLPSGMYIYRWQTGRYTESKKMLYLK
jgi:uncharacterized delta-60 repeat protein